MKKGNVLVIGNSGVGKSTLINSVLGERKAETGWGNEGTTKELRLYENGDVPFRLIDSVGFEPTFLKRTSSINAVKKWSKNSAKGNVEDKENGHINVIWFCVDGTSSKLFPDTIKSLCKAVSMWKSVPIIVVITKSYSVLERDKNIEMVKNGFKKYKKCADSIRNIIPVVASTYALNEDLYVPPEGITELIEVTNELLPEGIKTAESNINKYKLNRKRALAQSVVGASTTAGVIVGAVPIPFADAVILTPIELAEIRAIAQIYGIGGDERSKKLFNTIIEVGTVSAMAKTVIAGLKAIPVINMGAGIINSVIAGSFVAIIGEATIYAFEQVYLGNKTIDDIDWARKVVEDKLSTEFINKVSMALNQISDNTDKNAIGKIVFELFSSKK